MKHCENCLYYKDCDVQEFVNADTCEHYKRKPFISLFRLFYREPKTYIYEYGPYLLEQTSYNWHYMIFEKYTRKMVLHASCTKKLTKKQAIRILMGLCYGRAENEL